MQWVTRERPKVDRIACPWLIKRFVDAEAEFVYVPTDDVMAVAERTGAIPYDVPMSNLDTMVPSARSMRLSKNTT
jgi:hypothetical protein